MRASRIIERFCAHSVTMSTQQESIRLKEKLTYCSGKRLHRRLLAKSRGGWGWEAAEIKVKVEKRRKGGISSGRDRQRNAAQIIGICLSSCRIQLHRDS
jgi:hypothetical protein